MIVSIWADGTSFKVDDNRIAELINKAKRSRSTTGDYFRVIGALDGNQLYATKKLKGNYIVPDSSKNVCGYSWTCSIKLNGTIVSVSTNVASESGEILARS